MFTNYGGYWTSATGTISNTKPDNSHLLLGFTYNGVTYSTGVSDATLLNQGVSFQAKSYKAFELANSIAGNSSTKIGVGTNYGGAGNVSPVPVTNKLADYLTDGTNGLDLGTAVFNLPPSRATYNVSNISALSIGDNVPDIIVTQVGQPPAANELDSFMFVNASGQVVGKAVAISLSTFQIVANCNWKFYSTASTPAYESNLAGDRPLRMLGLDLSSFNLNAGNIGTVANFVHKLSGSSDQAFIAYNSPSFQASVGQVLPITLTSFEAGLRGDAAGLSWNAFMPADFSHFEIEASRNSASNFQQIGSVSLQDGNGYSFTDKNPAAGINYYRLKMVDLDGSTTYSAVKAVRFSRLADVSLAPNPATGTVSISGLPEGGAITLSDMSGKVLLQTVSGAGSTSFDISGLAPGLYIVNSEAGALRLVKN